jgi:gliding motility-associated-like protein
MMTRLFLGHSKRLIFCLLIMCFSSAVLLSQKSLSGPINQPKTHVVSLGADRVTVDNVTGFNVNDTILLIQLQGVKILTATNVYGTLQGKAGEPGMHEFMIILSINGGTKEIVFRNNILKTYDPTGNIQIVRVPYFNSATITGKLSCDPWDPATKSGGVLALIVGRTLTLNADIDVSKLGFTGGKDTVGDGICRNTNESIYGLEYYPRSFRNAGFKGEGVANLTEFNLPLGANYMKGFGGNWTGGGGGNGRYSGGGGGSNRGAGGLSGGLENCTFGREGGNGGLKADHPSLPDRIYMGGGGGASTSSPTGSASNGGNGGGIVIIVADGIVGNGGNILSDGGTGGSAVGLGGSGGGGAGGSIALSLNSYGTGALKFFVLGGNGGDNFSGFGEGSGGGGGLVYISTNTAPPNITNNLSGGTSSVNNGGIGELRPGFQAILNGFLFNTISSSVTDNQIDSICSNMPIKIIVGTKPVGGTGPYIYLWEKSYDQVTWIPLTNQTDPTNYTPVVIETSTVWFRRTITDSSPTPLVDVSKPVKIIVQPFIKNNIVGTSDTICFAQNPPAFTSKAVLQDGNGKYSFNWGVSLNNSLFTIPSNSHNAEAYTPPSALRITSWYRRTVNSGRCIDSTTIVKITVLDSLKNNRILNSPPDICNGTTAFINLSATTTFTTPVLGGGDNLYRFKWESNINSAGWGTAPGVSNGAGYDPTELPQRVPSNQYIFRRVVYSGSNDVCISTSNAVLLKDFPVISNNTVAAVPPICSGSVPANLIGSKSPILTGGNTIYTFSWQDSTKTHTWASISGATNPDYQPLPLSDASGFRRIVTSSACSDFSKSVIIIVHPPVLNYNILLLTGGTSQIICNGQVPTPLQGNPPTGPTGGNGSYAYQWMYSTDNVSFNAVPTGGTIANYAPPALTTTTYYRRDIISGACNVSSNAITITVLPLISNNVISGNSRVCYSLVPAVITGASLSGGDGKYKYFWEQSTDGGTSWNPGSGTNNSADYQAPALFTLTKYRRTVTSGLNDCCSNISNSFDIVIDPLPVSPIYAGPPASIYSIDKIYHMQAINPGLVGETGIWSVLDNGQSTIDDTTKFNTIVRNLSPKNVNSFLWTVHRGPCKLSDSVNITLNQDFEPKAFSPNGDGVNDSFIIEGLDKEDNWVDLTIVNGAGTEVFSTSNRNGQAFIDWNGKNSRGLDLSEGTYYYMLKITPKDGKSTSKKSGFIILKRY